MRIEDLVAVTEDGHEVLSSLPKDLQVVTELRAAVGAATSGDVSLATKPADDGDWRRDEPRRTPCRVAHGDAL